MFFSDHLWFQLLWHDWILCGKLILNAIIGNYVHLRCRRSDLIHFKLGAFWRNQLFPTLFIFNFKTLTFLIVITRIHKLFLIITKDLLTILLEVILRYDNRAMSIGVQHLGVNLRSTSPQEYNTWLLRWLHDICRESLLRTRTILSALMLFHFLIKATNSK